MAGSHDELLCLEVAPVGPELRSRAPRRSESEEGAVVRPGSGKRAANLVEYDDDVVRTLDHESATDRSDDCPEWVL